MPRPSLAAALANLADLRRLRKSLDAERSATVRGEDPGVIDSQSVKTTESGGPRGYDAGKKIRGRARTFESGSEQLHKLIADGRAQIAVAKAIRTAQTRAEARGWKDPGP